MAPLEFDRHIPSTIDDVVALPGAAARVGCPGAGL